jgi:hypothetical protein
MIRDEGLDDRVRACPVSNSTCRMAVRKRAPHRCGWLKPPADRAPTDGRGVSKRRVFVLISEHRLSGACSSQKATNQAQSTQEEIPITTERTRHRERIGTATTKVNVHVARNQSLPLRLSPKHASTNRKGLFKRLIIIRDEN